MKEESYGFGISPLAYIDMLQEIEQEQEGKRVQHDNLEGQALHKIK